MLLAHEHAPSGGAIAIGGARRSLEDAAIAQRENRVEHLRSIAIPTPCFDRRGVLVPLLGPKCAIRRRVMLEYLGTPMTSLSVKALICALALGVLAATPADAAKRKARKHVRAAAPHTSVEVSRYRGANLFPPGPVYFGNDYLGDDPDPFIRLQLLRDLGSHYGGASP
jgi:hypothetical protein